MNFRDLLEVLALSAGVAALGVGFFFYYTKESFRNGVNKVLPFVPALFSVLATKTKDTKGVFDAHDGAVLAGRLFTFMQTVVHDPANTSFEDVEPEVFAFLKQELDRYRAAGVKNVPDISDEALRTQVRVIFEELKRVLSENPAGNNS